jgi:hypothetical protein
MTRRFLPFALFGVLLAAAALAFFRGESSRAPEPAASPQVSEPPSTEPLPAVPAAPPPQPTASHGPMGAENQESAALTWTVPPSWQQVPNPNPMRIATYRVGPADTAADDAGEISVSRAGGTPEANVQRWLSQFTGVTASKRAQKESHGVKVTLVAVSGTYGGGMGMPGMPPTPRPNTSLLAAIAEPTNGSPYFFKFVGPTPIVNQARASFEAMVDSLAPR